MTTINDAQPGDIYIDANGKLWRILEVVREPTVTAEEVEGTLRDPNAPINKIRRAQTTADACWAGFTRIWRRPKP